VNRSRNRGSCVATPTGQVFKLADAHHDAAEHHERRGGKTKFLRAQQRGHGHVAAGLHLAVRLDVNAAAEIVQHERLVGFRQAEFHGAPACLMDESGDAPVPPSWPEIKTTSACAFATPAAMVPTPTSATSFTLTRALRFEFFKS